MISCNSLLSWRLENSMDNLEKLKVRMQELSGQWNGDESGRLEDQAHICDEVIEHIDQIEVLLKELEENSI